MTTTTAATAKSAGYSRARVIEVKGQSFKVWGNIITRATYAENEAGEILTLKTGGYITAEATIKREIKRFIC